ncbi:protein RALF-like 19 [Juglans regia]|uniref:Protein RALF-like 19 n=1 Tax=Juglans regia TaxID=51240 RepID=A0A2I4EVI0_JUGRE|nr:protein RALF-like 19 [Juglans regia]
MEYKPWLIFLVLSLAVVAESSSLHDATNWGLTKYGSTAGSCNSEVGVCIGEGNEMLMSSLHARHLAQQKYISYGALKANGVPCGRRGQSYYNCQMRQQANPYRRGCSIITHCARITD